MKFEAPFTPGSRSKGAGPASLFAALGDKTRLQIVSRLSEESAVSITGLTEGTRLTRQGIAKHLRVMERAGLVRCVHRGRERVWNLEHKRLEEARRYLDQISRQWDSALARLRQFVENG